MTIPLTSFIAGFKETVSRFFEKPVTIQYPDEFREISPRFRGRVQLRPEACIGCTRCSEVCPNASCTMEKGEAHPKNRRGLFPQVEISRCMYCGLCEEVCPTDAIYLSNEFRLSHYTRSYTDYDSKELTANEGENRLRRSDDV